MNRKSFWISLVLVGVTVSISSYFSVSGLAGIAKDPGVSLASITTIVATAALFLWFYRRKLQRPAPSVGLSPTPAPRGSAFASILPVASDLPHEVRVHGLELVMVLLTYGVGLIASVAGLALGPGVHGAGLGSNLLRLVFLAMAAACAYRFWLLRTPWLVLYPDRLEARGLTGWRTLSRSDIMGVRAAGSDRQGALFEVVPARSEVAGVTIRQKLRDDDPTVGRWFSGVRDLTAEAIAADQSAVLSDARYGATDSDRAKRLSYAKTAAMVFNIASLVVAAWFYFNPKPYLAALAAVIITPLLGALIVWGSDGLILWWKAAKARPAIPAAIAPALAVSFWSAVNLHLIGASSLIWAALALGLLAGAIASVKTTATRRWNLIVTTAVIVGLCVYGLVALSDVALDRSSARLFPLRVLNKYTSGSRSTSYNLSVGPWSDQPGQAVSVPERFYDEVSTGGAICISRRSGAFNISWFDIDYCPAGVSPPVDQTAYFPPAALKANQGGKAVVQCAVVDGNRLKDCRALSESPPGLGFGEAAVRRLSAPDSGINPAHLKGHAFVRTTVVFKLGS